MKRVFLGLVVCLGVLTGGVAYAAPAGAAFLCPACYGFTRVAPRVYAEKGYDADATLAAIEKAKARVAAAIGWGDDQPVLLICATKACAHRLGPGPRAIAYGSVLFT